MHLAYSYVGCVLFFLFASATPQRMSFFVLRGQDPQSQTEPQNQNGQQDTAQTTNTPASSAAPTGQTAPAEPPAETGKPAAENAAGQTAPPDSSPSSGAAQAPQKTQPDSSAAPVQPAPAKKPPTAAKRRTAQHAQKKKPTAASEKNTPQSKTVVKNGSEAEPAVQLAPDVSQQQASSQRQGTSQLLASTDESLKKISGRQLASNQQEMVQQIRKFMEQAKAANDEGDLERAHNLALKANLLAQELAKP